MSEKIRTFIAVELDKSIHDALAIIQDNLKKSQADVKWVNPHNIHLTLKFLGYVEPQKIEMIKKILDEIGKGIPAFILSLTHLGVFPKENYPRVIWVGIDKGKMETQKISGILEDTLEKIGIPKEERPFSAHLTLGRVRSGLNRQELVKAVTRNKEISPLELKIQKITLFKSTLSSCGSIYEALYIVNLRNT